MMPSPGDLIRVKIDSVPYYLQSYFRLLESLRGGHIWVIEKTYGNSIYCKGFPLGKYLSKDQYEIIWTA